MFLSKNLLIIVSNILVSISSDAVGKFIKWKWRINLYEIYALPPPGGAAAHII